MWTGWSLSSNVELETKIEANIVTLSVEEDINMGPFIIVGTAILPLFIIWLVILLNSGDKFLFFPTFVRTAGG